MSDTVHDLVELALRLEHCREPPTGPGRDIQVSGVIVEPTNRSGGQITPLKCQANRRQHEPHR